MRSHQAGAGWSWDQSHSVQTYYTTQTRVEAAPDRPVGNTNRRANLPPPGRLVGPRNPASTPLLLLPQSGLQQAACTGNHLPMLNKLQSLSPSIRDSFNIHSDILEIVSILTALILKLRSLDDMKSKFLHRCEVYVLTHSTNFLFVGSLRQAP